MKYDPLDPLDVDLDKPAEQLGGTTPPRSPALGIAGVAVGLVLALVLGYLYFRAPSGKPAPAANAPVAQSKPPADGRGEPGEQIPLPPLDDTDPLVRQLIARLSSHPTVAAWLTTDGLLLNFAVVTQGIANGEIPRRELGTLGPVPPFRTQTLRGNLVVDPSNYRRYDRHAQAVSSLDARGTARLYATLEPRILDAHRRLGATSNDFDPVLERAIVELLKVPVINGTAGLEPRGIGYGFTDSRLENLSAAQKQLLRMGPENVQTVQAKLREIADYLGIPVSTLPRPSSLTPSE